nr:hypothetical protein [Tanacetum cinerariifolium]
MSSTPFLFECNAAGASYENVLEGNSLPGVNLKVQDGEVVEMGKSCDGEVMRRSVEGRGGICGSDPVGICRFSMVCGCVVVMVWSWSGFLTHLHASKSGNALKWLGVVVEFKGRVPLIVRSSPLMMQGPLWIEIFDLS